MKMLKKSLSVLLVVVMLLTAAPLSGFVGMEWPEVNYSDLNLPEWNLPKLDFSNIFASKAEAATSGTCGANLTWTLNSGILTIFGTGAMTNYASVTSVPWYSSRASIKTVIIENGVTSIGSVAFNGLRSLKTVTIGNSVTRIGGSAFLYCTSLTSVTIGDSVTSIGDWAFLECYSLNSVDIPDSVKIIGDSAFGLCTSLTSLTIGDSVTNIGNSAFHDCTALTSVTIPDSVTSIGSSAFYNCTSLTSVSIGDSVTSIGSSAFKNCTSLTSVTIPDSVTSIGHAAFYYCTSLTSITIPDSMTSIGNSAFDYCTSLTLVTIPDSVTSIEGYAFYRCNSLSDVYYAGQRKQWNKITIGSNNDDLLNANIHFQFDKADYMASVWSGIHDTTDSKTPESGQLNYLHEDFTPLCRIVLNSLYWKKNPNDPDGKPIRDTTFEDALLAWEAAQFLTSPSAEIDKHAQKSDIYLAVVLDVFMDTLQSSDLYNCFDVDYNNEVTDFFKQFSSIVNSSYHMDFAAAFNANKNNETFQDILYKAFDDFLETYEMDDDLVADYNRFFSLAADVLYIFESATEFVQTLVAMVKISQMRDSLKTVLQDLAARTNLFEDRIYMASALELVSNASESALDALVQSMFDFVAADVFTFTFKKIVDGIMDEVKKAVPFYGALVMGAEFGFMASDALLATNDQIICYYTAIASSNFCEILQEEAEVQRNNYLNSDAQDSYNALVYMDAERLYISGLKMDCNNAQKFYDTAYTKGLINIVKNFKNGANANYEQVTEYIDYFKEYLNDFSQYLECSWLLSPAYLREDHPYEYQEFIKNTNIQNKKTVPYITAYQYYPNGKLDVEFNCLWSMNDFILFDGYEVFVKKNDEEFTLYDTINEHTATRWSTQLQFTDDDTYFVKIRAYAENAEGERMYSDFSNIKEITVRIVPPVLSLPMYSTLSDFYIDAYSPGEDYSATIEIYRRVAEEETPVKIDSITDTSVAYSDKTAMNGTTYYYSAVLILSDGTEQYRSTPSEEFVMQKNTKTITNFFANHRTTDKPLEINRVGSSQEGIELTWGNIPDAEKIIVIKKHPFAVRHIVLAELDGAATSYFDTDVSSGDTYEYNIVVVKNVDGVSAVAGTAEPQTVTIPEEARITWIVGKQQIVQYVTVGEEIIIPKFEPDEKHELSGWDKEIPAVATERSYTFTAVLSCKHDWDEGVITTPPTTESEGVKTYTCTFCGENKTESIPTLPSYTLGDVNGDDKITYVDVRLVNRYVAGMEDFSHIDIRVADIIADGEITTEDARHIYLASVGKEDASLWPLNVKTDGSAPKAATIKIAIEKTGENTLTLRVYLEKCTGLTSWNLQLNIHEYVYCKNHSDGKDIQQLYSKGAYISTSAGDIDPGVIKLCGFFSAPLGDNEEFLGSLYADENSTVNTDYFEIATVKLDTEYFDEYYGDDDILSVESIEGSLSFDGINLVLPAKNRCDHSCGTVTRGAYGQDEPRCDRGGFTGNIYCIGCNKLLETGIHYDWFGHYGPFEVQNAVEPGCMTDGYTGDKVCLECGDVDEEGTVIPMLGSHTWDDGIITTPPTTDTEGVKTFTCKTCGETKTESILIPDNLLLGDVDGDNRVSAADARVALRASVELEKLTDQQFLAADVDKNGKLQAADARLILRAAVGLETLQES